MGLLSIILEISISVFVLASMFKMGLLVRLGDVLAPLRNPRFLGPLLLVNFSLLPLIAIGHIWVFELVASISIGLFLVSICAGGPMLAKYTDVANVDFAQAAAFMLALQVATISLAPILLPIAPLPIGDVQIDGFAIFSLLVTTMLAPLMLGMVVASKLPAIKDRSVEISTRLSDFGVAIALILGLLLTYKELMGLVGSLSFLASALFFSCALALVG